MKNKVWIAVLISLLLLVGCQQTQPVESTEITSSTVAQWTTNTTGTTSSHTALSSTASEHTTTRPSKLLSIATKPGHKTARMHSMDTYQKEISSLHTMQDVIDLFTVRYRSNGVVGEWSEKTMAMFLEDKFYLIPKNRELFNEDYIRLMSKGYTLLEPELVEKEGKYSGAYLAILHRKATAEQIAKERDENTADAIQYTTDNGLEVTYYKRTNTYYMEVEGYVIYTGATTPYDQEMKQFVNQLSFEKIEIQ